MDAFHLEKGLYTRRTSPERQAVEGVPEGPPRPPNQPAQGLSGGSPLPQLCRVQGVTKPAPLADGISSSHREPQAGSGGAGTSSELGTHKHACEQVGQVGGSWQGWAGSPGPRCQQGSQTLTESRTGLRPQGQEGGVSGWACRC